MTRSFRFAPHGSGPTTAQGRRALAKLLQQFIPDVCAALGMGTVSRVRQIETGTHHLVWKLDSRQRSYALRASAKANHRDRGARERLWTIVGESGVAPEYRGRVRIRRDFFDGWLEAFDWAPGRHMRPSADHLALAHTLAKLHSVPIATRTTMAPRISLIRFLRKSLSEDLHAIRSLSPIDRLLRTKTSAALETLRRLPLSTSRVVLVHNDLVDANVIRGATNISLIDWDWAMLTQLEVDLFCFLSPFVRSWRLRPRFVRPDTATEFLTEYKHRIKRETGQYQVIDSSMWTPYNVLIANWLRRERSAPPHARARAFYEKAFDEVDKLTNVLASFK